MREDLRNFLARMNDAAKLEIPSIDRELDVMAEDYWRQVLLRHHERQAVGAQMWLRWPNGLLTDAAALRQSMTGIQIHDEIIDRIPTIEMALATLGNVVALPPLGNREDWDYDTKFATEFMAWRESYTYWLSYFRPPLPPFAPSEALHRVDLNEDGEKFRVKGVYRVCALAAWKEWVWTQISDKDWKP